MPMTPTRAPTTRAAPRAIGRRGRCVWLVAVVLGSGCATMGPTADPPLVPTRYQVQTGAYTVFTNNPLPADAPALRHLQGLERQLEANLGIKADPAEGPIEVYILSDREAFLHFLKFYYPELPARRAFFLAQGSRRVVYTAMGDRLEEDLRHEATHAILHSSVAALPLWLDEGLAEYFEVPEERGGVNQEHLTRLPFDLNDHWAPDLERLEALKDIRQMSGRDYREAWAWVHYMLNGPKSGRTALLAYLADLRTEAKPRLLSQRLEAGDRLLGPHLLSHIEALEAAPSQAAAPADPLVRLQDFPAEAPAKKAAKLKGFFARLWESVGL